MTFIVNRSNIPKSLDIGWSSCSERMLPKLSWLRMTRLQPCWTLKTVMCVLKGRRIRAKPGAKMLICRVLVTSARLDSSPHSFRPFLRSPKTRFSPRICGSSCSLDISTHLRPKFPNKMDDSTSIQRPRKRRAINACVNCRTSKVRCDGNRPCQRCQRNDADCQYYEVVQDEKVLRIERLEAEVASLRHEMTNFSNQQSLIPASVAPRYHAERHTSSDAINAGLITWEQARSWYQR